MFFPGLPGGGGIIWSELWKITVFDKNEGKQRLPCGPSVTISVPAQPRDH